MVSGLAHWAEIDDYLFYSDAGAYRVILDGD